MKNETKVEYTDVVKLQNMIEESYFSAGTKGKIAGKGHNIKIDINDVLYDSLKGMHNIICKLVNTELIDGSLRIVVLEEGDNITIEPVSIYCVKEDSKYTFY